MKRLCAILTAIAISTISLSAQQPTKWAVGVRGGCDFELIGRYTGLGEVAGKPMYLEGRFGTILAYASEFSPEGTAIAAWECAKFGESQTGDFSFDAGVAVSAGGWTPTDCWVLAGPMVRLNYTFSQAPISLGFDWTPCAGIQSTSTEKFSPHFTWSKLLYSFALSCTYNF
jgi:hypothetical protein